MRRKNRNSVSIFLSKTEIGEREIDINTYLTHCLAWLTKPDDSNQLQNIGHVCVFNYTGVNGNETICFSSVATEC